MVVTGRALEQVRESVRRGPDLVTLWRETAPVLAAAVPHFEAPCCFTVDPGSLLVTSHFQEGLPEIPAEFLAAEYAEPDYNSMTEVLTSRAGTGTLHDATGGQPELARKYHDEMQPFGCEQELVVALRTGDGQPWGSLGLYRETGRPLFEPQEVDLLSAIAPVLAQGVRHALRAGQAAEPDLPDAPGIVVLDEERSLVSSTSTAPTWLAELDADLGRLPAPVLTVAAAAGAAPDGQATVRVRTASGRWVVVHGSVLVRVDGGREVSVVMEGAQPGHLESLLMRAYGLTIREQEVTQRVLRGRSTKQVAADLVVEPGTVQQHLKSVFDKTGVRSRRELVSTVFARHYEPRVRDNEVRTLATRASRGGPAAP